MKNCLKKCWEIRKLSICREQRQNVEQAKKEKKPLSIFLLEKAAKEEELEEEREEKKEAEKEKTEDE